MIGNSAGILRRCLHVNRILTRYLYVQASRFTYFEEMKLYSDKGNPLLLRIFTAKNLAGLSVDTEYIRFEDRSKLKLPGSFKLPVLEVDDSHFLFSPNAICSYFLEQKNCSGSQVNAAESSAVVNQWLEWESTQLQPVLGPYLLNTIGQGKTDTSPSKELLSLLGDLNSFLKLHSYLSGGCVGLADVAIWGSLYPLLASNPKFIGPQFDALIRWNTSVSAQKEFARSVEEVTKGQGLQTFKASLLSQYGVAHGQVPTSESKEQAQPVKPGKPPQQNGKGQKKQKSTEKEKAAATDEASGVIAITKLQATAEEIQDATNAWIKAKTELPTARKLTHPILPQEGEKNVLVTSALPYVNNVPHLGNIIGCVLSGDVFARYCRLRGLNTLYICGTDEYGTATETKALEEGLTPKEICDKYFEIHYNVYKWFNIYFDHFGRTTTKQQTEIAQDIFWRLHKRNHLVEDTVEQLQCLDCKRFLADRFVEGTCPFCNYEDARGDQCDACGKLINATELKNPKCKVCGGTPEKKISNHLFLNLAELEPSLKAWFEKSTSEGNWSANSRQITRSWIQEGLKPRCITRDLKWGTPVPLEGYTDKVFYVWFDAPIGYLSITADYTDQWEKWWKNPSQVTLYQFMAKDNVPFHTVVFPSTLIGANDNYTLLNNISATEYLNYEDDKFSKSRGVGVFGDNASDSGIPADIWRFYLLFIRPEGQDSAFSWADFATKNNSELLNNLGNFINRALMFLQNNFNGVVPELDLTDEDRNFIALVNRGVKAYGENMDKIRLREGLKIVLNISKYGNQFVQANKPWVLIKGNDEEKRRAATVVGLASNLSFMLSVLVRPFMPSVSDEIQSQLQVPAENNIFTDQFIPFLRAGHKIGTPKPLFQKIEPAMADKLKAKYAGKKAPPKSKGSTAPNSVPAPSTQTPPAPSKASAADIEALQAQVTKQGEKVRELKTNKAEKAVIDAEVASLLDLKKQLALAEGKDPNEKPAGSSKSKKKGKGKK